ncbi:MAG: ABC transporter substrate-binding protein [Chitinophagaceae bacterium]
MRIGLLLPRSTDYPALGFDLLDGIKGFMKHSGVSDIAYMSENIGYGEDAANNYAKAEKLILEGDVDMILAYCDANNAYPLYDLASMTRKPFIFVDPGMRLPQQLPREYVYHITLQGTHACSLAGQMAGDNGRKVLLATSFYDGGYDGPYVYSQGLDAAGGAICGNYVSGYKVKEFSIEQYISLLESSGAQSVAACFSSYLAALFLQSLKETDKKATALPFYCAPFMAEEQLLAQIEYPGGTFHAVVPWASDIDNDAQHSFKTSINLISNKSANLFHLLGWEAGAVALQFASHGLNSLNDFSYESPRGKVVIDAETHYTYAPLYKGMIVSSTDNKCRLVTQEKIWITAEEHKKIIRGKIADGIVTGWRNNYLCI